MNSKSQANHDLIWTMVSLIFYSYMHTALPDDVFMQNV